MKFGLPLSTTALAPFAASPLDTEAAAEMSTNIVKYEEKARRVASAAPKKA